MKKLMAIILSAAMVVSLAACGSSSSTATTAAADTTAAAGETTAAAEETTAAEQGKIETNDDVEIKEADVMYDEVSIVNKDSVLSLYPWTNQVAACLCEVYEKLYDYSDYSAENVDAVLADATYDGNFLPGCDHEDGTGVYTVHIAQNIYDHAGNHMTASDVKFSWDYVTANVQSNKGARAVYEGCEIIDDYTVEFTFGRELTGLREFDDCFADFFILTEAGYGDGEATLSTTECGTGPYTVTEFTSGSTFTVEAYEDYWAKDLDSDTKCRLQWQNVKVINYLTLDDKAQQVTALETGELDAIQDIKVDYLSLFKDGGEYADDFNVLSYMQSGQISISPNNDETKSAMGNKDLRLALFYATDTQGYVDAMGGEDYGVIVHSLFGAGQADQVDSWATLDNYQNVYDLDKAAEYMKSAGYNGETLTLCAQQSLNDCVQLLQNMWVGAGFNIELVVCDQDTYNQHKLAGDCDIFVANSAGYCGAVQASRAWGLDNQTGRVSADWVDDQEWVDMLSTMNTVEGHTEENCDAWMTRCFDNAYDMGLATTYINNVVSKDILDICRNGKNSFMPGAFIYDVE